jgi:hypothetical protein
MGKKDRIEELARRTHEEEHGTSEREKKKKRMNRGRIRTVQWTDTEREGQKSRYIDAVGMIGTKEGKVAWGVGQLHGGGGDMLGKTCW